MTESTTTAPRTPPDWLNSLTSVMLRTPGLQRLAGRSTALITFTGRTTGKTYTTPVTYTRDGEGVIMTAHVSRQWWRNLDAHPEVELRLAGEAVTGRAEVLRGDDALPDLITYYQDLTTVAKAAGIPSDAAGRIDPADAAAHLTDTVVVRVRLA